MFYRVVEDTSHESYWWLGQVQSETQGFGGHQLTAGRHVDPPEKLRVRVQRSGAPTNFSFALAFVPIVSTRITELINKLAPGAVEAFPVEVGAHKTGYDALNVVRVLEAIDRERSEYILWKPEDERPDKIGQFRQVHPMVIKSDLRQEAGIFRPVGWEIALIVSAGLKKELERMGPLGVHFRALQGGFSAN